jgi:two-component system OmpR family sensor kinase
MSLRRRLVLGFALVAIALVVGGYVLAGTMRDALIDRVDSQLRAVSGPLFVGGEDDRRPPGVRSDYVVALFDRDGNLLDVEPPTSGDDQPLPDTDAMAKVASQVKPGEDVIQTVPREDGRGSDYRVRGVVASQRGANQDVVAVIGQSLADVDHTFREIVIAELITAGVVLAALALVAYWVLRQGVRPLDEIADAADAIAEGDLSRRVSHPSASTEAGRVGIAFNRMLTQIEDDIHQRELSERRLKQFAADASHELRTPLTSIRGYADLWRQGGLHGDDAIDDAMRRIEGESARMGRLVEDLLLLARLDEGIPLQRTPVDLSRIANDVVADARVVDPMRPITVDVDDAVVVIGDDDRLRQVLGNLVTNARAHTPAETPVHVTVRRDEGAAVVVVRDEGPGMDDETAERAFERFYRADKSRSRAQGGTGLGLSIVSAVVNALGGTVRLETGVGRGSTFSIRVPLAAR